MKIDLVGTVLEGTPFEPISRGISSDLHEHGETWIACRVVDGVFDGAGDAGRLDEIVTTFLDWAEGASPASPPALPLR